MFYSGSGNPTVQSVYPSYRIHTIFLAVFSLAVLLFLSWITVYTTRSVDRLRVRNDQFEAIVRVVCTNFLSQALDSFFAGEFFAGEYSSSAAAVSSSLAVGSDFYPDVVSAPNIGFATSFQGRTSLIIDGVRYVEGDFCSFGRVERIDGDRAYCSSSNGFVVLRYRPRDSLPAAYKRSAAGSESRADFEARE